MIPRADMLEAIRLHEEMDRRKAGRKLERFYPDTGPLRRELYPKHLEFFRLGKTKRERLFLAANRIGKTEGAGGFEVTCHLTGRYPPWWEGARFDRPVRGWAAGNTLKKTKEILQAKLLGEPGVPSKQGTGLVPRDCISRTAPAPIPNGIETVWVKHASGGDSVLAFKSYDQGREAFEGTEQDFVWCDEEPPLAIYTECLLRTMTTRGLVLMTFTPLMGMSETVMSFLPDGQAPEGPGAAASSRAVVGAGWDDVPHLSEAEKAEIMAGIPPFQRDARSKGIPQLGSGAIFPIPESDLLVDPFPIPKFWKRGYGLDVGWNVTAAGFHAIDPESGVVYRYDEYRKGHEEPAVHAEAIKARGDLPGVIDPASRGRSQADGQQLIQKFRDRGLDIHPALNAVEAGLFAVWERMTEGRYKVFRTCVGWLAEFRTYQRDEKGRVIKRNDHHMDETRYFCMSGIELARSPAPPKPKPDPLLTQMPGAGSWMG